MSDATTPDSKAPSSFDALMKTHSTALTRPWSSIGVTSATVVARMFMLIMSTNPVTASAASESGSHFDRPKTIIAGAEDGDDDEQRRAGAPRSGRRARSTPAASAPIDGAVRSAPSPIGPMSRIVRAKTGASAIESPSSTAKRSSAIAPSSIRVRSTKWTPATRLAQSGGGWSASGARAMGQREDRDERDGEERCRRRVDGERLDGEDDRRRAAGPTTTPICAATLRSASAPWSSSTRDDLRRERARRRAADGGRDARRARRCVRNGHSACTPASVTARRKPAIPTSSTSDAAVTSRREHAVGELSRRQREDRQRHELREPDEPEVERVAVDRVHLPADRDGEHLRREPVRERRRPEQREVALLERREEAAVARARTS